MDFDDLEDNEEQEQAEREKEEEEKRRLRAAKEAEERAARAAKEAEARAAQAATQAKSEENGSAKLHEVSLPPPVHSEAVLSRCEAEKSREVKEWKIVTLEQLQENHAKPMKGMFYGMEFPWSEKTLVEKGPAWLTKAFHAAGTLSKDNSVTEIRNIKAHIGGGSCSKLMFDVAYAKNPSNLPTALFAKIPYPFEGKLVSDRISSSINFQVMELKEISVSRVMEAVLPCEIPTYVFGDIANESTNFMILTARVPYGQQIGDRRYDIPYEKMRDWELLGNPSEYYYLLVKIGAKIAGMYKSGELGPQDFIDKIFGTTAGAPAETFGMKASESTGLGESEFTAKLKMGADFISQTAKALFPTEMTTPEFIASYRALLTLVNTYQAEINWWTNRKADYIAWTHGNLNVDNAYFWRDTENKLQLGILDWGGVTASSVGTRLWWWLYCCEPQFLLEHLDGLLQAFIDTYAGHGGPRLEMQELKMQFYFGALSQGIGLLGAVPQIYRMCSKKEWPSITDRRDPRISNNIDGKNTLRIYIGTFISICHLIYHHGLQELVEDWADTFSQEVNQPRKIPRANTILKATPFKPMDEPEDLWEIVGGADKGGILVREGESTTSAQCAARLSTGAVVRQLNLKGERLQYRILRGSGPQEGWISIRLKDKELAVPYVELGPSGPKRRPPAWKLVKQPSIEFGQMKEVAAREDAGDYYGIRFPYTAEMLEQFGAPWLTEAFRKSGVLTPDNAVVEIRDVKEFVGGGAGLKCTFTVAYKEDKPYLHKKLFAKLPHKPGGSDRYFVSMMWNHDRPEIIFNIFMSDVVPFRVPKFYFGDIAAASTNFILITESLEWGEMGKKSFQPYELEPAYDKYKDWELPDGGPGYYLACCKALGKMAGYHKSGRLHPKVNEMFPMPPAVNEIPKGAPGLSKDARKENVSKIDHFIKFMSETAKKIFPPEITEEGFLAEWKLGCLDLLDYQSEAYAFCSGAGTPNPQDYVGLTHNNLQIDNAFFWRNDANEIEVGMLDWGILACGPLIGAVFGCISGATEEVLIEHLDSFLAAFIDSYAENGGPKLDASRFKTMALLQMAQWSTGRPANVVQVMKFTKAKEWTEIEDWMDPRVVDRFQVRTHCSQHKESLVLWRRLGLRKAVAEWKASMGLPSSKPN